MSVKRTSILPLMLPFWQPACICLKFEPPPDTKTARRFVALTSSLRILQADREYVCFGFKL